MLTRRKFLGALAPVCALARSSRLAAALVARGREYHVSVDGNDAHDGSAGRPLRTIAAAADRAYPGDTVTVHEGVYRERVSPPRGGKSDGERIVYRAAPGERVEISGAEAVKGWALARGDVWKIVLPNSLFGTFNPYSDVIHGDWFDAMGRVHHTGAVYLNGDWLDEAAALNDVFTKTSGAPLWFGQVEGDATILWAQFRGTDPNKELVEINVRQTVFYPERTGIDYITVRGFILRRAATPWAPPTAEQIGAIGPHWSKGWVIENNEVSHSRCSGISLGKYGDQWDNKSANSAEGYVKTIERAEKAGWSKENVGGHVVRGNTVSHCEQAGIVGSLGPAFSTVTGNTIHDIHVRQLFSGAEIAGIKFHAAIDVEIGHNYIYRCYRGMWLDWMAQGTRVTGNLFHGNQGEDLFVEVDHGPFVVDNNLFLSKTSQRVVSQGGAYAHNLFCGGVSLVQFDGRMTPFMKAHSTAVAGYHDNPSGDMRFYNNIFAAGGDLSAFNVTRLPIELGGNVFLEGATACAREIDPLMKADYDAGIEADDDGRRFGMNIDGAWATERARKLVASEMLGRATIPDLPFERADGTALRIDTDFRGRRRNAANPFPGPFENGGQGRVEIEV